MLELLKKPVNKAKALCTAASVATITTATMPLSLAAPKAVDADKLIANILTIVFDIFLYIGILLLAWSIGMLVLAFKNEDADSKSKAMMLLVVSIVLIGLKALFKPIASSLGISIS